MIQKRARLALLSLCLLLIVLAGCGGSDSPASAPQVTPTTLPPGATSTSVPVSNADWTTYHLNNARSGYVQNAPDPRQLTQAWKAQLDGAVYAEPLVIGGRVIVVTEGDSLYSLESSTGKVQWHTKVGTPVPLSTLPCGNIDPLGITGTPVFDPATGLVFAVAEVTGPSHILVGVDVTTGQVRVRRGVDIPAMEPAVHQQRAALALYQDMVYIVYGGLNGDCGNYHGTVVASRTDGSGPLLSFQVPTPREGGIWAPPGPAIDANGDIFVSVGNGSTTQGDWDHSDSILRLSPTLQLQDGFAPTQWQQENASDADLGSMGPILLPGGLIFAAGKGGEGYLLRAASLGGVGGQAQKMEVCRAFGGSAAMNLTLFVPCTDGVRQVIVGPGATMKLGWQAPSNITGSPIIGGHTVYTLDPGGTLYALDAASGSQRASISIDATSRFATPTLSGTRLFVGTLQGVVAVTIG